MCARNFRCFPRCDKWKGCFAFAVSSTSDVCVPKLLRSHTTFLMARVILMWAPSRVLGLILLALSPKGLLTYKRIVICPQIVPLDRPLYHCSLCAKDGHKDSFCYYRARKIQRACASRILIVHSPSHGMNTCEPKKAHFVDGFYDTLSSELDHARGHASSVSCLGPRHVSHGVHVS
jgi:hypothetical protein